MVATGSVDADRAAPLILIGGLGFVARNIIQVAQSGAEHPPHRFSITAVDDLSNAAPGYGALTDVAVVPADYGAPESHEALNAISGPRTFVFLAGETRVAESKDRPLDFIEANIAHPARFVMKTVRPGDRFVLTSTAGALFDGSIRIRADSAYCPRNFYGASKAAEEMLLEKLVKLRGGTFSIVRMTNVYGRFSERKLSAIHAFVRAAVEGREITISGDGNQTRDFIYAGDAGRGILTLVHRNLSEGDAPKVSLLGSGVSISINAVVAAIEPGTGRPLARRYVENAALLKTEPRDVMVDESDVGVLLADGITPLTEGLTATCAYYGAHGDSKG